MKRSRLILVATVFILVAVLMSTACSSESQEPTPTSTPTSTVTQAEDSSPWAVPDEWTGETIELTFSDFQPVTQVWHFSVFGTFCSELERRTGGRVKVKLYGAEALGKAADHLTMAKTGLADIAFVVPAYTPGVFPLATVLELPFAVPSSTAGCVVGNQLLEGGYLSDAWEDGVKTLWLMQTAPRAVISTKPVKTLADMKGMKIRTWGDASSKLIEAFGGTPVAMSAAELYTAMQTGLCDATLTDMASIVPYRLEEIAKYVFEAPLMVATCAVVMNEGTWEALPPEVQEVIEQLSAEAAIWSGMTFDSRGDEAKTALANAGVTVVTPSAQELQKWYDAAAPMWSDWVEQTDAKGLAGDETRDALVRMLAAMGIEVPY